MDVSIVISTLYKRPEELKECLESIGEQTVHPREVIIINGASDDSWKKVSGMFVKLFKRLRDRGIVVRHVSLPGSSLTHARNTGAKLAKGDIVLYLDDDVILDRDYLKGLLKVYTDYPNTKGVQGFIVNRVSIDNPLAKSGFLKFFWWVLQHGYYEIDTHKQLPSLSEVIPYKLTRIIKRGKASVEPICRTERRFSSTLNLTNALRDMQLVKTRISLIGSTGFFPVHCTRRPMPG